MLKLLIADDHPLLLEGLYNQLINVGYSNVFKASNGKEAYDLIRQEQPNIAILDIEMPFIDGLSIAQQCKKEGMKTSFIILTYHREPEFIIKAKSLNISGYILKEDALHEIENCLQAVINGENYYSKVFQFSEVAKAENTIELVKNLSPSEIKILKLIAENKSTTDIANMLFISERTVEKHRSNIIAKLELKSKPNVLQEWLLENKSLL